MFSQRTSTVKLAMLVVSALAFAIPSHAQSIVDSSGVKILSTPPASVYNNAQVNLNRIIGFQEGPLLVLTEDQKVDLPLKKNNKPITIKAGTLVKSYFFSADPGVNKTRDYSGYITFSGQLLGIIDTTSKLDATDSVFGSPNTLYPSSSPNDASRGLEASDIVGSPDGFQTVAFFLHVNGAMDQFRVLVTVPEAAQTASFGIGALGLFGLIAMARKHRQIV